MANYVIPEWFTLFDYMVIVIVLAQMVYTINDVGKKMIRGHRGRKLRKLRMKSRLTVDEVAAIVGTTKLKIQDMEDGCDESSGSCYKKVMEAIRSCTI